MTIVRLVIIRGRVQGVGFRAFVEDEALRRGIAGWVRNRSDGTVEALFSGAAEAIAGMIEACRKGPYGARVDGVKEREGIVNDIQKGGTGQGFLVLPTA